MAEKKSAVTIAREKYEGELANARAKMASAQKEFERATHEADQATIAAGIAKANADKARQNMDLETRGIGIREDGTVRKAGQGKYFSDAKLKLEEAQRAELAATVTRETMDAQRKAQQAVLDSAQQSYSGVSDEPVRLAMGSESAETQRMLYQQIGLTLAGAGIGSIAAMKYGKEIANAAKDIRAALPLASNTTPEGRRALASLKSTLSALKSSGALNAMGKAKMMLGAGMIGVGVYEASMYLADGLRTQGNDSMADAVTMFAQIERGAAAVAAVSGAKAFIQAKAGKPLGSVREQASFAEAEAKAAELDKTAKKARLTNDDRAKLKASREDAMRAKTAAEKAQREATAAKKRADREAKRAHADADARARKQIADQKRADTMKAKAEAKRARELNQAKGRGRYEGRKEVLSQNKAKAVAQATRTRVTNKVETASKTGERRGYKMAVQEQTSTVKAAKSVAARETRVFRSGVRTGVSQAVNAISGAVTQPAARGTMGTLPNPKASKAAQDTLHAAQNVRKTVASITANAIRASATAPSVARAIIPRGRVTKAGLAVAGLTALAGMAGLTTASQAQAQAQKSESPEANAKRAYTKSDGSVTQGTTAQIEHWQKQKAK